jgi:hypothetical protein
VYAEFASVHVRQHRWPATEQEIEDDNFTLKTRHLQAMGDEDTRTVGELLDFIDGQGQKVAQAQAILRTE